MKKYYTILIIMLLCLSFNTYKAIHYMYLYHQIKFDDARHQQIANDCIRKLNKE